MPESKISFIKKITATKGQARRHRGKAIELLKQISLPDWITGSQPFKNKGSNN